MFWGTRVDTVSAKMGNMICRWERWASPAASWFDIDGCFLQSWKDGDLLIGWLIFRVWNRFGFWVLLWETLRPFGEYRQWPDLSLSSSCCFPLVHFCVFSCFSSLCASFSQPLCPSARETTVVKASHRAWPSNWETYHGPIQSLQEVRGHELFQCPPLLLHPPLHLSLLQLKYLFCDVLIKKTNKQTSNLGRRR